MSYWAPEYVQIVGSRLRRGTLQVLCRTNRSFPIRDEKRGAGSVGRNTFDFRDIIERGKRGLSCK